MMNKDLGDIFVISAPSGTGKTTLAGRLLSDFPTLVFSVSYTTRPPRSNEINGKDYFFISKGEFEKKIAQGEMIEWAEVYGNYYGTSATFLRQKIEEGKDILLDIDIQGAKQVKQRFPESVLIFISPPSFKELEYRLKKRGTDPPEIIAKRLQAAKLEMEAAKDFDHIVINDDFKKAIREIKAIIVAYKTRVTKRWWQVKNILRSFE